MTTDRTILITGVTGQLGGAVAQALKGTPLGAEFKHATSLHGPVSHQTLRLMFVTLTAVPTESAAGQVAR